MGHGRRLEADKFGVLPHPEWVELALRRRQRIAAGEDPDTTVNAPGFPPTSELARAIKAAIAPGSA